MMRPRVGIAGRLTATISVIGIVVLGWAAPAVAANPTISSFTPGSGPSGCIVTINGSFASPLSVSAVKFGGTDAAAFNQVSTSRIYAKVGAGTSGVISVTDAGGTGSSSLPFTVASPGACAPSIASLTPNNGPIDCGVTIVGTNLFSDVTPTVDIDFFNGKAASPAGIPTSTQVSTHVPTGATTGVVSATTWETVNGPTFTVPGTNTCAPTITSFSPTSGTAGAAVTITGTNLLDTSAVKFNGVTALEQVNSTTSITAIVPAGATTGPISVTTGGPGGPYTVSSSSNFTVSGGAPTITSFTPTSGGVGTSVVITGTNFTGATSVVFNTTNQPTFTVNSATQITATVPTGATTGPIHVTTPAGTATSSTNFTVVPKPTITSFTPTIGPPGTSVTISGTNFSGTGFTTSSVKFNVTSATTFTVNSTTRITATVPTGATTGKISVTTPGGTATSTSNFTVGTAHPRSVTLSLRNRPFTASGRVSASDGFSACVANVPVRIQRRRPGGGWHLVKSTLTTSSGAFRTRLSDVAGTYRARAPRLLVNSGADICQRATSPTRTHR